MKNDQDNRDVYCPIPFHEANISRVGKTILCRNFSQSQMNYSDLLPINKFSRESFAKNTYLNEIRNKMLTGCAVDECINCYKKEDIGMKSPRQSANERFTHTSIVPEKIALHLKLGNQCNLKCKTCAPTSSSSLFQEWDELGWVGKKETDDLLNYTVKDKQWFVDNHENLNWPSNVETMKRIVDACKNVHTLKITGGEPMLVPGFYRLLKMIKLQGYDKDIRLQVTTNGTVNPELYNFFELTKNFKKVIIDIGIDGKPKTHEYLRWPVKWETIQNVMDTFKKHKDWATNNAREVNICMCVSHINLGDLPWFEKTYMYNETKSQRNSVYILEFPSYYRCDLVSGHYFEKIITNISDNLKNEVQSELSKYTKLSLTKKQSLLSLYKQNNETQDKFRGIKQSDYIFDLEEKYN